MMAAFPDAELVAGRAGRRPRAPRPHGRVEGPSLALGAPGWSFYYRVSYRSYMLSKVGIGLAYLWYVWDFFQIHLAAWAHPSPLLLNPSGVSFVDSPTFDPLLRGLAVFLNGKAPVWTILVVSPSAVGAYLWGRSRWLQIAVGIWMSFSMITLISLAGVFASSADIWLHYDVAVYPLAGLLARADTWKECEPGISWADWQNNPAVGSTYAMLIVCVEFTVYFFAGVNKLVFGWAPWTSGTAIQSLAFDASVREFVRGIHVPHVVSFVLCYVTLFQRLVVPFGFFVSRYRMAAALILGLMHIGYAMLMHVNLFPLVGLSSLLMVWPHRASSALPAAERLRNAGREASSRPGGHLGTLRTFTISVFVSWLLLEPARLTLFLPMAWENKLMVVPVWRMFADGGAAAGGEWRLILWTSSGKLDATAMSLQALPHLWRDRFLIDTIFHDLAAGDVRPDSLAGHLLLTTKQAYRAQQVRQGRDPTILQTNFDIYISR
jgi:hypothetical protein